MACPHGCSTPETCSQCRGVTARQVTLVGGKVLVDGVETGTSAEHTDKAEDSMFAKPKARRGGRSSTPRQCTRCFQPGHNRARCTRG